MPCSPTFGSALISGLGGRSANEETPPKQKHQARFVGCTSSPKSWLEIAAQLGSGKFFEGQARSFPPPLRPDWRQGERAELPCIGSMTSQQMTARLIFPGITPLKDSQLLPVAAYEDVVIQTSDGGARPSTG